MTPEAVSGEREARLRYLAEASRSLASSLDPRATLERIARLAVPRLADGCAVDILDDDGRLERVAAAHVDPDKAALAFEVARRWPLEPHERSVLFALFRRGEPRHRRELSDEALRALAHDEAHLEMLRAFGMRSSLIVPLEAEGRVVGALTLVMGESGRLYEEDDLELAMELARRASLSIENARLYTRAEQARARIERLQALTAALSRAATLDEVTSALFAEGLSELGARRALIGVVEDGLYRVLRAEGFPEALVLRFRQPRRLDELPLVRDIAASHEPVYASSRASLLARFPEIEEVVRPTGSGARAFVPLIGGAGLIGIMALNYAGPRRFSVDERGMLEAIGRLGAQAIERARLTSALEEQRARLRAILDNAPAAIFVKDPEGRLVDGNPAFAELAGRPLPELLGRFEHEVFPAELAARLHADDREVLEGGACRKREDVMPDGDGARTYLSVKFPIRDLSNRVYGVGAIATDITERKRVEETLAERERAFRALADSVPQMIWSAQENGEADFFNRRWLEFTGSLVEDNLGWAWTRFVHPDDRSRVLEAWKGALASRVPYEVEYRMRAADGSYRWFLARALPFYDAKGGLSRWFGACTDVDDQRRAREDAERASQLKDEFLATLSHELRTPLTVIDGWVQILKRSRGDPERTARAIEVIERNARAQAQIVDDVLDVSRIVSGQLRVRCEPVALDGIVRAALDVIRPAADARGVRLEPHLESGVCVRGDADRLHQVVWNLLSNAVKFSHEGGVVRVGLDTAAAETRIAVEDGGQGIRREFLPHVFERFSQGDASFTRKHGGLGLGLAIVRQLVELHGGHVEAFSEGEGRGARFTVRLPLLRDVDAIANPGNLEPASAARRTPEHKRGQTHELAGVRVLLVEDEDDTRELLAELLQPSGAEVRAVGSAGEGMEVLRREPVDVIVSDLGMPDVDGLSFLKEVRALPVEKGGGTPALALTAYTRDEDRSRALHVGYQSFLTKPVDADALLHAVGHLAGRPHAPR